METTVFPQIPDLTRLLLEILPSVNNADPELRVFLSHLQQNPIRDGQEVSIVGTDPLGGMPCSSGPHGRIVDVLVTGQVLCDEDNGESVRRSRRAIAQPIMPAPKMMMGRCEKGKSRAGLFTRWY